MAGQRSDSQSNVDLGEESGSLRAAQTRDDDSTDVQLEQRDPGSVNGHLKVMFEDVFAEPHSSVYSFDSVWTTSFQVFRITRTWCYRITTLICAVPASVFWAVYFTCLVSCSIWCCRPCIRAFEIKAHYFKGFCSTFIGAFIQPFWEAAGSFFSNLKMVLHKNNNDRREAGFRI